ncbi:FAD-dependent monooxygenase [Streptomyces sp. MBT62]|uniref:FAD-dependent monooxygenase n=1 Tax=Streptomyces sp. MBT62 TaxID=2800410 RepID=UPI00190B7C82|nr:FAD-dependent monooxygenase [Streptomyces sp. MBT62]MBK3571444.1 FAD-dependent monooxygenase [Streptomyces sp. MBT62]
MTDDVLIVGAGPTGLTLAIELARRGVGVRIVDAARVPHRESRGKGLQPRTLEVLEDVGGTERVLATGTTRLPFRKYFDGKHVNDTDPFADALPTPDAPYERGVLIGQWQVEQILRDRLAEFGVGVQLGAEVAEFEQDTDGVTAALADGERIRAGYLVGCDGGRSRVRKVMGVRFDGTTEETQSMVVGDVRAEGIGRDVWHQWFTSDGGGLALCPMPGTDSFQLQASPELDADGEPLPPSLESFQRIFDRYARVPGVTLTSPTWLSVWRVNVRMVDRMRVDRVLLAGDAAHVHPIAGGLGMNTGIQDAYNLGWKLALVATGQAGPGLLDTYEEERLPVAAWTLGVSTDLYARVLEAVKEPGTGIEVAAPPPMGTGYPWSSLAGPAGGRTSGDATVLRPGDRAPDAPCLDASGNPVRLFQMYADPRFTLLGFGTELSDSVGKLAAEHDGLLQGFTVDDDLRDHEGHARRAYGITGPALVLIRPDNHVALFTRDPAEVTAYLTRIVTITPKE